MEINKIPSFLSPSSLNQARKMPNYFYLTRLVDPPLEKDLQNTPAAIGTYFDILIKEKLIQEKFPVKAKKRDAIWRSLEVSNKKIKDKGKRIFDIYTELAFDEDEYKDVELSDSVKVGGVPLVGQLDASVSDASGKEIPFDWKVTGSNSKSGVSPMKGYYKLIDGMKIKPRHKDYYDGIRIEEINEQWGIQSCTYGWLLGYEFGQEFNVRFDQIVCRPKGIKTAKFIGRVTPEFQNTVFNYYKSLWDEINDGSFLYNLASEKFIDLVILESLYESWF